MHDDDHRGHATDVRVATRAHSILLGDVFIVPQNTRIPIAPAMANAAEKKRSTTAVTTVQLYKQIIMALYAAYVLLRVFWCWSSFTFGVFFVLLIISALNFLCLNMVQQALELGTSVSGPQDFLFINWAVMSLAIVWDRSYILYLAIPAYLGYQYGGVAKGYFFPAKAPEMVKGEADLKREAKKERQAARQAKLQGR